MDLSINLKIFASPPSLAPLSVFFPSYFDFLNISNPHIGFTKGFTVGFGGHSYTWDKGFELAEKFLQENIPLKRGEREREGT